MMRQLTKTHKSRLFNPILILLAGIISLLAFWGLYDQVLAQSVAVGEEASRKFGQLEVRYRVDNTSNAVKCTLLLGDTPVGQQVLTEVHPAYRFAFRVDQLAVDGVLKARFVDAPRLSTLNGDLTSGDNRFKGVIASWVSGEKVHPQSQIYALTPEISIQTAIRGEAKSVVEIVLLNGSKTMYTATLMQTAPLVRTKSDIVLGTALIKAGATFKLTIPTQLQKGSVIMTGEYQSGDNTLRKISAVIAIWEP